MSIYVFVETTFFIKEKRNDGKTSADFEMGQQQKFCHSCGTQLIPKSKYCGNCGLPILTPDQLEGQQPIIMPVRPESTLPSSTVSDHLPHIRIHAVEAQPVWERPNSIFERVIDVIFRPRRGFAKIARSPELVGPLIITGVLGLLEGGATYLLLQSLVPEWKTTSDPDPAIWDMIIGVLTTYFVLLSFLSLISTSILLFGLMRILGRIQPQFAPLRQSVTIVGYARIPEILFDLLYIVSILSENKSLNILIDDNVSIPVGLGEKIWEGMNEVSPTNDIMLLLLAGCLLWSFGLIYLGIKNTQIQPDMHMRILIPYMFLRMILLFFLMV